MCVKASLPTGRQEKCEVCVRGGRWREEMTGEGWRESRCLAALPSTERVAEFHLHCMSCSQKASVLPHLSFLHIHSEVCAGEVGGGEGVDKRTGGWGCR